MIKKAYVIGGNTSLSLSPLIFNYWFKKHNIKGEYNFIEINENNFEKEIKKILDKAGLCGLNITVPFKEKIIPFLSKTDNDSRLIGAVNCVTKKKNQTIGSNTDWIGFKNSILELEKSVNIAKLKKNKAVVVGYGGSAKATIYALDKMGFSKVFLWNRSFDKIKEIKRIHKIKIFPKNLKKENFNIDEDVDIAINTIPSENFFNQKNNKVNYFNEKTKGYDLVYNKETSFLKRFPTPNRINGISLLIHQAAPCFETWFGVRPEIDKKLFNLLLEKVGRVS